MLLQLRLNREGNEEGGRVGDLCHDREWQGKETVDLRRLKTQHRNWRAGRWEVLIRVGWRTIQGNM